MSEHCYHCQAAIPVGTAVRASIEGEERAFCCHACLGVAELISSCDLSRYYAVRENAAPRPQAQNDAKWQAYDIAEIAGQYVHQQDGQSEIHLYIEGIHCGACAWLIRSVLKEQLGLEEVFVNVSTARAEIRYGENVKLSQILAAIASLGYVPNLFSPEETERRQNRLRNQHLLRLIVAGLGMMQVMMFATGLYTGDYYGIERQYSQLLRWISLLCTTPVFFYSGLPFLQNAWAALKMRRVNMDVPVAFAIAGAYFASVYHTLIGQGEIYFDSVTMFIFFLSISRFLEFMTHRRARLNDIRFAKLLPEAVERREADGSYRLYPLAVIQNGDVIRILPAQTIAIDGVIVQGSTRVDEAMLSGESTAVSKAEGDNVLAGSHNLASPVDVQVSATGQETTLAGIRRLMARAEQHKSVHIERNQEIANWTILTVLILAALGYVLWQFIAPERAFEIALAILVATCPCALSLATPAALTAAMNHAHAHGILIKQSDTLDRLPAVRHILFDKTGTLSEGDFRLMDAHFADEQEADFLWQIVKSLQMHSPHPIAWAMSRHSPAAALPLDNVQQMPSQGVCGDYQGQTWAVGNAALIRQVFPHLTLPSLQADTGVAVYLANARGLQAQFVFADPPRADLAHIMAKLSGYQLHIASGDKTENVRRIAEICGIADYHAQMLPQDKLHYLQNLDTETLMIGDGINDAPVMAAAAVSVAVGKANPLSQTQADIVLLQGGPELLPYLFELAQRARHIMRQNLFWASFYNALVVPLAICGYLTPWIAALGMSASSLLVVLNALRISRMPAPKEMA